MYDRRIVPIAAGAAAVMMLVPALEPMSLTLRQHICLFIVPPSFELRSINNSQKYPRYSTDPTERPGARKINCNRRCQRSPDSYTFVQWSAAKNMINIKRAERNRCRFQGPATETLELAVDARRSAAQEFEQNGHM